MGGFPNKSPISASIAARIAPRGSGSVMKLWPVAAMVDPMDCLNAPANKKAARAGRLALVAGALRA
jgi:hypothetical protein